MDRTGIFAGDDPFAIARTWLAEAEPREPNDPNAIALATVDQAGLPNVRMVLLKDIEADAFVFYTNYTSRKGQEIEASGKAAFVLHWGAGFLFFELGVEAAALHHEAGNHAMENRAFVVLVVHVLQKVGHGFGGLVGVQLGFDLTHGGADAHFGRVGGRAGVLGLCAPWGQQAQAQGQGGPAAVVVQRGHG